MKLFDELVLLTAELDGSGIEYALCGGLSLALHGYSRATRDIDLLIRPDQINDALAVFAKRGYDIRGTDLTFKDGAIEIKRTSKIKPDGELLSIDAILVTPELKVVWEEREVYDLGGSTIWAVSRAGLLTMKRIAGRPQDLADIHNLEHGES